MGRKRCAMAGYKGYCIDNVIFSSKEEIDIFLKNQAVEAYKTAVELFVNHSDLANSGNCDKKADILVNRFGFSLEDVEELEIETINSAEDVKVLH